ncbi:AsmA family protein [Galbibacter sp. EGI 63066]|uniref:AsmA family protein n=1 Tax=Galbibacter sp. EGI 63066 TaxID=2993559 RepID=UPI002248D5C5|nr:AsmA family protein [Galbibacter sp. EGI 63066]MCX2681622.1 AsmA family protein [Galbibacter sp. EGI 63066]
MKKILKIIAVLFGLFIIFLIAAPFLFEGKIVQLMKKTVNNNINAKMDFADASISLIRNFPNTSVSVKELSIVNNAPFEGDTLIYAERADISIPFMQLFNDGGEPYSINSFSIDGAQANILVDEEGNANYDIAKESDEGAEETAASEEDVKLSIKKYEISNSKITYYDAEGKLSFVLDSLNHSGKGDLSASQSELDTETNALVSFELDSVSYLKGHQIRLDALLGIDLDQNKYTFLENKALINQLELVFDGFVKVNDDNQEVDISFKTPSSDFKNFLAVMPEEYSKDIENVQTTGDFAVEGTFKGIVDETHIPTFDITINSENASFKYPDLPQSVNNIHIDTRVANESGLTEDTYVDISKLSFKIAEDVFNARANIKNITDNPLVNANLKGRINLANLSKAYPFPMEESMKGILDADVNTSFDMNSIEKERYGNTKNNGSMTLKGFEYSSSEMKNPVQISSADMTFNTTDVTLNSFEAKTGQTDFSAKGSIHNLLGYMFNKELLKGNFTLNSNTFAVNDFMTEDENGNGEGGSNETEEEIKIPSFLDATVAAKANTVLYDNLKLKNVSGTLIIRDETVNIKNLTSNLFGGKMAVNGSVSTKTETPIFNMDLGMNDFNISESIQNLELLQAITPIANAFVGTLNSNLSVKGNLNNDFSLNMESISGNALAEAIINGFSPEKGQLLTALSQKVDFLNFGEEAVKNVKTALTFDKGKVNVKPFHIKYKDIDVEIAGSHGFDKSVDYNATFNVPAKYLGKDVNNLIARLDDPEAENMLVPVTATIGGTYGSPSISTDLNSTVSTLTKRLVQMEKEKLMNKGTDKVKGALTDILTGTKTKDTTASGTQTETTATKDSTRNEQIKNAAGDLIKGLFGGKKKDTTNE